MNCQQPSDKPLTIWAYLCSRVGKDAHPQNNAIASALREAGITVYVPHEQKVNTDEGSRDHNEIFKLDATAMKGADICIVVPRVGKDCCGEIGWFASQEVPIVAIADWDVSFLDDPMIKGWIDLVLTTCDRQVGKLLEDPYFYNEKVTQFPTLQDIAEECRFIGEERVRCQLTNKR